MRIVFVSSECAPYSKTGGLADVAGSLPKEFLKMGHEVLVITPRYREVRQNLERKEQSKKKETNERVIKNEKTQPIKKKKVGRNEPCPCGSGKKYKQCCGK